MAYNQIIRSRSPLRLGLGGGGTDIESFYSKYGGAVLNATINLYACCTIKPTNNNKIKFVASDLEEKFECPTIEYIEPTGNLKLHKAIYNHIVKNYNNNQPISHEVITYCDVPAGSGLGSSSTLVVSIVKAYSELLSLPFGDYDISHIAYEIERIDLGMKGGKQDQYAATFGGFNFMEFYENDRTIINPLRIRRWIISELEQSLIIFNTGTSRESSKIIDQQNRGIAKDSKKTIESMLSIKQEALNIKEHLLKGNFDAIADSIQKGWVAKKNAADSISNSKINDIYDRAINAGAMAGKISGAGGGGFFMFLTKPSRRMDVLRALAKEDGQIYPCHFVEDGTVSWTINKTK
ncbi:MAG: dehydrogenase [Proteobacteria bacterium]|nr:dehydrogenase [Pseudomonadota bacterium]